MSVNFRSSADMSAQARMALSGFTSRMVIRSMKLSLASRILFMPSRISPHVRAVPWKFSVTGSWGMASGVGVGMAGRGVGVAVGSGSEQAARRPMRRAPSPIANRTLVRMDTSLGAVAVACLRVRRSVLSALHSVNPPSSFLRRQEPHSPTSAAE